MATGCINAKSFRYKSFCCIMNSIHCCYLIGPSDSICDIINHVHETGIFPDDWKKAKVHPIFKSFCLRDRGRLGNRGGPIWLKFGTLTYYGDLCNKPKFQLHCSYFG